MHVGNVEEKQDQQNWRVVSILPRTHPNSIRALIASDIVDILQLGFGAPIAVSPPIIRQPDGRTTFYAKTAIEPPYLPPGYAKQYARSMDGLPEFSLDSSRNFSEIIGGKSFEIDHLRYGRGPVPEALTGRGPGYDGVKAFKDPRDAITRMDIRSM